MGNQSVPYWWNVPMGITPSLGWHRDWHPIALICAVSNVINHRECSHASLAWDLAWHEYLYESVFAFVYVWVCLFAFVCFCQYSCEMLSVVLGRGAFPHPDLSSPVVQTGKHLSVKNSPHHIVKNYNNNNNNNNNSKNIPKLHPNPNCHTAHKSRDISQQHSISLDCPRLPLNGVHL